MGYLHCWILKQGKLINYGETFSAMVGYCADHHYLNFLLLRDGHLARLELDLRPQRAPEHEKRSFLYCRGFLQTRFSNIIFSYRPI